MQQINLNGKQIGIASSFEDLDDKTYLICAEIVCKFQENDVELARLELGKAILGFEEEFYDKWKLDCVTVHGEEFGPVVFYEELGEIMRGISEFFFYETEEGKLTFASGFTRNLFPRIDLQLNEKGNKPLVRKYFGPKDKLSNITLYELATIFTEYETYLKDQDETHLHKIIAILYRPAKQKTKENVQSSYEGDIRLPFRKHESTITRRMEIFKKLDSRSKDHIIFFFANCRVSIMDQFKSVFDGDGTGSKKANFGWAQIIWELAENLTNVDKVDDENGYNALAYLQYLQSKE